MRDEIKNSIINKSSYYLQQWVLNDDLGKSNKKNLDYLVLLNLLSHNIDYAEADELDEFKAILLKINC